MTTKEVKLLKTGDFINHSRYGVCRVKENLFSFGNWFGVSIMPIREEGMGLLHADSGSVCNCVLEDSLRRLKGNAIVLNMPKFVVANDSDLKSYGLYEWQEGLEGQVDDNYGYCFKKIRDFASRDEALLYKQKQRNGTLDELEN